METLKIAIRKFAPFENAVQKIAEKYRSEINPDVELEIVSLELEDLYRETISEKGLKTGKFDLAIINTDWIFETYTNSGVEKLNDFLESDPPEGYPNAWANSLIELQSFENSIYGLPFHDGPECLIYRKDLFENPEEKEKYYQRFGEKLEPPKTWEQFRKIVEFFQRPEENLYGTAFAGFPDGHNTVFDFCIQLWTRNGDLVTPNGKVSIASEAAKEGLEFYRNFFKNKKAIHPDSKKLESVGLGEAFARGEIAMMVNWFGFASVCEVAETSKVKGKVEVTSIPHNPTSPSASLNVYYLYALASGSKNKELAYQFLKFAVNAENDKLLTKEGGIGCRKSTWKDPEINKLIPYYHKLSELHKNAQTLPQKSNWAKIASIIDEVVLEAVNTGKTISEILKQGQEKINSLS